MPQGSSGCKGSCPEGGRASAQRDRKYRTRGQKCERCRQLDISQGWYVEGVKRDVCQLSGTIRHRPECELPDGETVQRPIWFSRIMSATSGAAARFATKRSGSAPGYAPTATAIIATAATATATIPSSAADATSTSTAKDAIARRTGAIATRPLCTDDGTISCSTAAVRRQRSEGACAAVQCCSNYNGTTDGQSGKCHRKEQIASEYDPKRGRRGSPGVEPGQLERQMEQVKLNNSSASRPRWVCRGRRRKHAIEFDTSHTTCTCDADTGSIAIKLATASVNTLAPQEAYAAQALGQGLLVAGKIQRLEKEFSEASLDIIGVQETRFQCDVDVKNKFYHILGSTATTTGNYGIQLLIALKLKARVLSKNSLCCAEDQECIFGHRRSAFAY